VVVHFFGMAALEINPDPTILIPEKLVSNAVMGALVIAVVLCVLLIGFGSFLIETKIVAETETLLQLAALHDALTTLPNRAHLQSYLRQRTEVEKGQFIVITIDVDRFRAVNAQLGNTTGDKLLLEITGRLTEQRGPEDFIARTGPNEFVVLRAGLPQRGDLRQFATEILDQLSTSYDCVRGQFDVSISIGTAMFPMDSSQPHDLLQKSQYAMLQAKGSIECGVSHYDAEMDAQSRAHDALVSDLCHALVRNQFFLNFQPQNDIKTHEVVGFEVLCRWRHPDRGLVPPSVFIPIAEDIGLIKGLGLWVLREACNEAVQWEDPYRIAVNVAPKQLDQPDFVALVDEILETSGLAPDRLELEITEASIIDDKTNALAVMHQLKARGISIAMDDFGTGYSSLASLQAFPFDKIKIDRSFVQDVHEDVQRAAIVRSTLLLGAALNIPVLAEGIESENELEFLQGENCAVAQGFYFGRPMPIDEVRQITGGSDMLQQTA